MPAFLSGFISMSLHLVMQGSDLIHVVFHSGYVLIERYGGVEKAPHQITTVTTKLQQSFGGMLQLRRRAPAPRAVTAGPAEARQSAESSCQRP